jgi:hypothetical protein
MTSDQTSARYMESGLGIGRSADQTDLSSSGVSWGAVIGGAFVAAALYLILLALGAGFGLSSISPWSNAGASASTVGTVAIVWLIIVEIISSSLGGYLTGRLRTKWVLIHTDEVYFRDTANGFLAWAVALVITVAFLASAATSMVGHAVQSGGTVDNPNGYFVDALFRADHPVPAADVSSRTEAALILTRALGQNDISAADQTYLARLVAARTGLTQSEAEQRVSEVVANARQDADTVRRATAHLLLWIFLALLMGAFSASYAATIGGRQRDHVKTIG